MPNDSGGAEIELFSRKLLESRGPVSLIHAHCTISYLHLFPCTNYNMSLVVFLITPYSILYYIFFIVGERIVLPYILIVI
jgi:hypothetical protein